MRVPTALFWLASSALCSAPLLGAQSGSSRPLSLQECLNVREAANKEGSSLAEIHKACGWTNDKADSEYVVRNKPRAADAHPFGLMPEKVIPPTPPPF